MEELDLYSDNLLFNKRQLGPIGPSSGTTPYIVVLVITKFLHAFGVFIAFEQLKTFHISQFLFIIKLCSAVILVIFQKPISSGKRITPNQWYRIAWHSVISTIVCVLWLQGLTLCGALRTILLTQHSDLVVLAALGVLFHTGVSGPSKHRGAILFVLGILALLLFDNDSPHVSKHPEGRHDGQIFHMYYQVLSWLGLPDHKLVTCQYVRSAWLRVHNLSYSVTGFTVLGGLIILLFTLLFNVVNRNFSRKLAAEIGGAKRLNALSSCISTLVLLPWCILSYFTQTTESDWLGAVFPFSLIILFIFIVDFYVESFCASKMEGPLTSKIGSIASFVFGIVVAALWDQPWAWSMHEWHHGKPGEKHSLSGGTVFSALFFILATRLLCRPSPRHVTKGNLIGYTTGGLPIYNFHTPQSVMSTFRGLLRQILEESESRQIFYFLCLNLLFTGVELSYGVWTNSLGLISDGFHMLFDCTALVLGLCAALMSRWKATRTFSYGYGRVEILSGYVNGIFLVVIAFFVLTAALQRLFDPPTVKTEKLLAVSVGGLLVNLVGIFAFRHAHSHGGGGSSHASHGHSHANHGHGGHGHGNHGHGHSHQEHHHDRSVNMEGVFLHVLADTMGSVGVIVSSVLIEQFGWFIADPICSLFIGVMIFISVLPLLRESSLVLLQRTPLEIEHNIGKVFNKVLSFDGVLSYRDHHFWQHSSDVMVGTIHVQVAPSASEQKIIQQITALFKEYGVSRVSVQVEKEAFFHHMSALSAGYKSVLALKQGMAIGQPMTDHNHGVIKSV